MRFVDAHTHPIFEQKGVFKKVADAQGIELTLHGMLRQMDDARITHAVGIGVDGASNEAVLRLGRKTDRILPVLSIPPEEVESQLRSVREGIRDGRIRGLKVLLGYWHVYPDDRRLKPLYALAEREGVPVIFHTGDNWRDMNNDAILKYSRASGVEMVAHAHRDLKIQLAHLGCPNFAEAYSLAYSYPNVYADISGWWVAEPTSRDYQKLMERTVRDANSYAFGKLMWGTDWPLATIPQYIDFFNRIKLDEESARNIAHGTAKKLWGLDKQ